jgi:hypothetical protein
LTAILSFVREKKYDSLEPGGSTRFQIIETAFRTYKLHDILLLPQNPSPFFREELTAGPYGS